MEIIWENSLYKTFSLGKIAFTNPRRRTNPVKVGVQLKSRSSESVWSQRNPEMLELSICASILNQSENKLIRCGQCMDIIRPFRDQMTNPELFDTLYDLWRKYHSTVTHPGTPEQEALVDEWKKTRHIDPQREFFETCKMLDEKGKFVVYYTGRSATQRYCDERYRYGQDSLIWTMPPEVIEQVKAMLAD